MVLVAPFYLGFVLFVFEVGFLMLAGLGARYAAHAAARSAVVWHDSATDAEADLRPRQAAWAALAPYAGGSRRELASAGPVPSGAAASAPDYSAAVRRYGGSDAAGRKFLNAAARTTVTVEQVSAGPRPMLRATVTFRAPLTCPVVSRFMDPDRSPPFEYPITAAVTLPSEAPQTDGNGIGIGYTPVRPAP
jgi:Flp pilus assembly protein TadG